MNALVVPPKVPALIARLASPHDGEVLATVAALRRVLASDGLDLNDLAAALDGAPAARATACGEREEREEINHRDVAEFCWVHGRGLMSPKERRFVLQMLDWRRPTEKQIAWLHALRARVVGERG